MIFASNPRCYNTKHAWMPTARACHNACVSSRIESLVDSLNSCRKDLFFHFLACAVLLVQLYRERRCFVFIVCEQQVQRFFGSAQTASGIQSGPKLIAYMIWRNWRAHSGELHQFFQTDARRSRNFDRAALDQQTVLVDERHDVSDGTERHKIEF